MKVRVEIESKDENGEVSISNNPALMELTDQGLRLSYVEDVSGEGNKTRNTLLVTKESLHVLRSGTLQSEFVYGHERKHHSVYKTPYGDFPVTIHTKRFLHKAEGVDYENKRLEQAFHVLLELEYALSIGGDAPMCVSMRINIFPR